MSEDYAGVELPVALAHVAPLLNRDALVPSRLEDVDLGPAVSLVRVKAEHHRGVIVLRPSVLPLKFGSRGVAAEKEHVKGVSSVQELLLCDWLVAPEFLKIRRHLEPLGPLTSLQMRFDGNAPQVEVDLASCLELELALALSDFNLKNELLFSV